VVHFTTSGVVRSASEMAPTRRAPVREPQKSRHSVTALLALELGVTTLFGPRNLTTHLPTLSRVKCDDTSVVLVSVSGLDVVRTADRQLVTGISVTTAGRERLIDRRADDGRSGLFRRGRQRRQPRDHAHDGPVCRPIFAGTPIQFHCSSCAPLPILERQKGIHSLARRARKASADSAACTALAELSAESVGAHPRYISAAHG
jgi:hypothetical protein